MKTITDSARVLVTHLEPLELRLLLSTAPLPAALEPSVLAAAVVAPVAEQESPGGPTNDDLATAQALEFGYLLPTPGALTGFGPQQAAVQGAADGVGQSGGAYWNSAAVFGQIGGSVRYSFSLDQAFTPGLDGSLTITAMADLAGADKYLTIDMEGIFRADVFVDDGLTMSTVSTTLTIPLAQLAQLAADGVIQFTITPSPNVLRMGSGFIDAELAYAGPSGGGTSDYYSFSLAAGESAAVHLMAVTPEGLALNLCDAAGNVVAGSQAGEGARFIDSFVASQAGTYYVCVAGQGEYTLVVDRNATLEHETLAPALPPAIDSPVANGRQWVLGQLGAPGDLDVFAVTLEAKKWLDVQAYSLTAGTTSTAITLRLYDAQGHLVAQGNDALRYRPAASQAGTYCLEVSGSAGTNYALGARGNVDELTQHGKPANGKAQPKKQAAAVTEDVLADVKLKPAK